MREYHPLSIHLHSAFGDDTPRLAQIGRHLPRQAQRGTAISNSATKLRGNNSDFVKPIPAKPRRFANASTNAVLNPTQCRLIPNKAYRRCLRVAAQQSPSKKTEETSGFSMFGGVTALGRTPRIIATLPSWSGQPSKGPILLITTEICRVQSRN